MKTPPTSIQVVRELLGLALIGFVLWLAAIGWLSASSVFAFSEGPRAGGPEAQLARLQTQLNLTAEQVDQIRPILENLATKRRDLMADGHNQDRRLLRIEMQKLREETESALAAVLTADQTVQWQQLRENRRGRGFQGRP